MVNFKVASENDMKKFKSVSDPRISTDGESVVFVMSAADGKNIWIASTRNGETKQLTSGIGSDEVPRLSPDGKTLGFVSNRNSKNNAYVDDWQIKTRSPSKENQIYLLPMDSGESTKLTSVPNGIVKPRNLDAFVWSEDGKRIAFLSTDPFTQDEEKRFEDKDDVFEFEKNPKYTRIYVIDLETGETTCVSPEGLHVWEFSWSPDNTKFAVISSDLPYEGSWFTSCRLVTFSENLENKPVILHQSKRQVAMPKWSSDGNQIAFLSSNYSDRGSVDGDLFTISSTGNNFKHVTLGSRFSVRNFIWNDDCSSVFATCTDQGGMSLIEIDLITNGQKYYWNELAVISDDYIFDNSKTRFAVVREDIANPKDIWIIDKNSDELNWKQLTKINPGSEVFSIPKMETVRWKSIDGKEIQGLLLYPLNSEESNESFPLYLAAHGGPTSSIIPNYALGRWYNLLANGIAVFIPSFRGSTGFGLDFAEANIGDLGGMDWHDINSGIDSLVAKGIADPDRLAIGGGSYGGFMTAWAVTQTTRFKAAVARAGIYDWRAFHGKSYINGWEVVHFGGSDFSDVIDLWEKFSPINYVNNVTTPTLILHGELDLTCPVEGAYAFYRSLKDLNVETELVVYPREGHGTEEKIHKTDEKQRHDNWIINRLI